MKPQADGSSRTNGGVDPAAVSEAQTIAIEALSFMATESERLLRFLRECGLSPHQLRTAAASPGFLAAVIDHFAADATLVETYAANAGRDPAEVARAREILVGSQPWTST